MNDLDALMEQDASPVPSDGGLSSLSQLIDELEKTEKDLAEKKAAAELAQAEFDLLRLRKIPDKMSELGMAEFTTSSGASISIKKNYYAGISEDNKEAAMAWLTDHGLSDIIKANVIVPFSKGQAEAASKLKETLREQGYSFESKDSVHASTLKALVKRRIEAGQEIDFALFSIHVQDEARVERPKEKK